MFARVFLNHPRSVDESYLGHARFAFGFALALAAATGAALVHALIPCLFEKTASRIILSLAQRVQHR